MRQGVCCHGEGNLWSTRRETECAQLLQGAVSERALNHGGKIGSPSDLGVDRLKPTDWSVEGRRGTELNSFP